MFDYQKKVTAWEDSGTEPPEGLRKWQAGEKPPAAWWNWFWDAVGKCFDEVKSWINEHQYANTGVHGITTEERIESQEGAQAKINAKMTEHLVDVNPHPQYIEYTIFNNAVALINKKLNPPGKIAYFARCNPPNGWLEANGALLSRSTYPDLWQEAQDSGNLVTETVWSAGKYGSYSTGDDSTTFRIPDLRGRGIIGSGQGINLTNRSLASTGGDETHTLVIAEMPVHKHTFPMSLGAHFVSGPDGNGGDGHAAYADATNNAGGGQPHNNMQPYAALLVCIKD